LTLIQETGVRRHQFPLSALAKIAADLISDGVVAIFFGTAPATFAVPIEAFISRSGHFDDV